MKITRMDPEQKVRYLTTEPIPKLVRELSIPTMVSMMVTAFYNMADTAFVGRLDNQSTAAVGVAFSAMAMIQAISFLFGHGSGNYISRQLGARNYEDARHMAATSFFTAFASGVVLGILGILFVTPLSRLLGSTPTILPYTVRYLRVIFVGTPFIMCSFVLNNHLRFQGNASVAMIGIVTGAVANVLLDPLLIFGLSMGVEGAALATVISQIMSFVLLWVLHRKRAVVQVHWHQMNLKRRYLEGILKGGIPSMFRQGLGSLATVLLNLAAGYYGGTMADQAIAAMGVVGRITAFANSALIGFGQGFQPICGTNYGAGCYKRVREAFFFCLKLGSGTLAVFSVLGILFAHPLMLLFRNDEQVARIGALALRAQCLVLVLSVWIILCSMLLQTIGMAAKASVVASARQGIMFVPMILLLPWLFGLAGVQFAQMAADILSFALTLPIGWSVLEQLREDRPKA